MTLAPVFYIMEVYTLPFSDWEGFILNIEQVSAVYFSPTGKTKQIVCHFAASAAKALQVPLRTISLDLPAFRENLIGKGTPAVALVTYGNRSFDNSLAELCAILKENAFNLAGAGAFVAGHAFSKILAAGRPDDDDLAAVADFAVQVARRLQEADCPTGPFAVDGDAQAPYYIPKGEDGQPAKFLKAAPKTDMEKCVSCGLCARLCPMGSIDRDRPDRVTGICIKCQRCVHTCPYGAKYFDDPAFLSHVRMLEQHYKDRASNKIFTR